MENGSRIPTFDIAKAVVLLMVVGGHLVGNGIVANCNEWCDPYFANFKDGVTMPLFYMMSGYFSATSIRNGSWGKIIARTIGFLWPVAAFGVIFGFVIGLTGTKPLWKILLYPAARVAFGGWFLLTLAIIYSACAVLVRLGRTDKQRLILLLFFYVVLFFMPRNLPFHWSSNVFHMFPYFVFGMFVLRPYEIHKNMLVSVSCGIVLLVTIFFEGNCYTNGMSFYYVPSDWQTVLSSAYLSFCIVARTVIGIAGSVFVLWLIDLLCHKFSSLDCLAFLGTTTLGIYVMHEWPLVQLKEFGCMGAPMCGYWKWPIAIGIFLLCHFLTLLIKNNAITSIVFFGSEKRLSECIDKLVR